MSISEGSLPTCRWLQAGVLLVLASGLPGCLHRVHQLDKARWRPATVPGACKVYIQPEQAEFSYGACCPP